MKGSWPLNDLWSLKAKVEKCIFYDFCLIEIQQYLAQITDEISSWCVPERMAGILKLFWIPVSMCRQMAKMSKCPEAICVSTVITMGSMARLTWNLVGSFCMTHWMMNVSFQIKMTSLDLTWTDLIVHQVVQIKAHSPFFASPPAFSQQVHLMEHPLRNFW